MQIFFSSRSAARAVKYGKMVDNGTASDKRWGCSIEIQRHPKQALTLMACKDHRKPEQQKPVIVKIKKSKTITI